MYLRGTETILAQYLASLQYGNCRDLLHIDVKSQFQEKKYLV